MNPLAAKIHKQNSSDFLWDVIVSHLPGKVRRSRTEYLNFNCPMCVHNGETPDTKQRCGIRRDHVSDSIKISCFNCGFSTGFKLGNLLFSKMRAFLKEIGVEENEIAQLNFKASIIRNSLVEHGVKPQANEASFVPNFPTVELPSDCHPITKWAEMGLDDDPDFLEVASYVLSRGGNLVDKAYWSPEEKYKHRAIFPCYYRGRIVGWTGRITRKSDEPKYVNHVPANYLSNCDVMNDPNRHYLLLAEGYLDGEAIDGISPFGAKLNPKQVNWIKESGKTVIVIPDRDKSGKRLINVALENEWMVAFPRVRVGGNNWWEEDCKDCAEAVKRYGRLYTLRSIIETATDNRLEIEVRSKWLV